MKSVSKYFKRHWLAVSMLLLTWGSYFAVFWPKMLYYNQQGDLVAGWRNIWGDWAMHISQAQAFAQQPVSHVLFHHPIYQGIPLSYPFVINFISGMILRLTDNLVISMLVPVILLSLVFLLISYWFGVLVTRSRAIAVMAISLFLTSGGLGFTVFLHDLWQDFTWSKVWYPTLEYTHVKDDGIWWTTTLLAHLVPQRAFLFGMVVGIGVLIVLFYWLSHRWQLSYLQLFGLGVVVGGLAFIHTHSLLFFFFFLQIVAVFNSKRWRAWLVFVCGVWMLVVPFMLFFHVGGGYHDMKWLPGWLANSAELDMPVITFWWLNWGLTLPIMILGIGKLIQIRTSSHSRHHLRIDIWLQYCAGAVWVFLLANLVRFQPSTWDNHKLFLWVYWFGSYLAAIAVYYLWKQGKMGKFLAPIVVAVMMFSGVLDLWRVLHTDKQSFVMVSAQEIASAKTLQNISAPTTRVLTSDTHLHWVPLIAGRGIAMGYRGWLWSHGIDYAQREQDIKNIYQGLDDAKDLMQKYNIDYVVVDKNTQKQYDSQQAYFDNNFETVISTADYRVYTIQ